MSCKTKSAFWLRSGYWLCNVSQCQAVSIAFFPFSLAILFNLRAFSVLFISPSNSVSRSRSISLANSLASFTTECQPFPFSCIKASRSIQSSHKFKDRKRLIAMFYKIVRVGSNPSPRYFLGGKDVGYQHLGDACCMLQSSF